MHIKDLAAEIATAHPGVSESEALAAARLELQRIPAPDGFQYNEAALNEDVCRRVRTGVELRIEDGKLDPAAGVRSAFSRFEDARAAMERARAVLHAEVKAARAAGVPSRPIEEITGYSRNYIFRIAIGEIKD